mgnify:CR=1 FL=1|jgi:hypothetical protein
MISTEQIEVYGFKSLEDFERFRVRWIRICAVINSAGKNAGHSEEAERRAKLLQIF